MESLTIKKPTDNKGKELDKIKITNRENLALKAEDISMQTTFLYSNFFTISKDMNTNDGLKFHSVQTQLSVFSVVRWPLLYHVSFSDIGPNSVQGQGAWNLVYPGHKLWHNLIGCLEEIWN